MKKTLLLPLIFCFSCSGEMSVEAPGNLIPIEKMIPIIVDLQILESHFQRQFQRPDLYKKSLDSSSTVIFDSYQVSKGAFDSSYNYYAQDVDVIYAIYEAALDSLNFRISDPQQ
jgi:hypothetical protein